MRIRSEGTTNQKLLDAQFHQAQRVEAIGQFAGGVAHDLNNLLTAILGYGELLKSSLAEHDPHREDVEEIVHAAERAAGLTKQLVMFGRWQPPIIKEGIA